MRFQVPASQHLSCFDVICAFAFAPIPSLLVQMARSRSTPAPSGKVFGVPLVDLVASGPTEDVDGLIVPRFVWAWRGRGRIAFVCVCACVCMCVYSCHEHPDTIANCVLLVVGSLLRWHCFGVGSW